MSRAMPSRAGCWLVCGLVVLVLLWLAITVAGSVVVRDRTGEVTSAVVTNDREEQPLYRLPGGVFVGIPQLEGVVEISCGDGSRHQQGYVTGHMHTWVKVEGRCGRMVEIR